MDHSCLSKLMQIAKLTITSFNSIVDSHINTLLACSNDRWHIGTLLCQSNALQHISALVSYINIHNNIYNIIDIKRVISLLFNKVKLNSFYKESIINCYIAYEWIVFGLDINLLLGNAL